MTAKTPTIHDAVQKANDRFELIAKATNDTIWDWNLRTNEIWWNDNFYSMFGFPVESFKKDARSWTDQIHPDDHDRVLAGIHKIIDAGEEHWQDEYRFRKADGSYATVFDRGYTMHDANGAYRMVGSMQDISERKQAEARLADSEERMRIATEATRLGTWDLDLLTGELRWDLRSKELFGVAAEGPVDYAVFLSVLHPGDRERVDRIVQRCLHPESGGNYDTEYRAIGQTDQTLRWISAKGQAFFTAEGKPYRFIGTVLDITEKKLAEEELKESDERLREALLVASTGTWKIDLTTGIDTRDASLNKILGLVSRETHVSIPDSFSHIYPDDQQRVKLAFDAAIEHQQVFDEEYRAFLPNGELHWLKDRGQVVYDEANKPLYMIGATIDVTGQKQKEEALKFSEERFSGLFYNSAVGMAMVNVNGSFIQVNPVCERMFGYTNQELLQLDIQAVSHPEFTRESITRMQQLMLGEAESFTEQKKYIRKNGEEFWGEISVTLVKDITNRPSHFIAIVNNIHERKLAEDALKMQARVLDSMDEGVSVADEEGVILYTNTAEDKMFGYEPGELVGLHVTVQNAYSDEENRRIVGEVIEQLATRGFWNGEWHNRRKNGSDFYTYSHITSLDLGSRRVLVCVQRDITDEKKYRQFLQQSAEDLERRVHERTGELQEANEQLARSNAELEQFAYITSHDLQEPLRKIKTFTSRMEDELAGTSNDTLLRHLGKVSTSAERMSALIRDLLNYSRLTKERTQFDLVNLDEVVKDVLSDLEVLVVQKHATIKADGLPVVPGIRIQLGQLFFNLIANSLKFSTPGLPPVITVEWEIVEETGAEDAGQSPVNYYRFKVQDNGIGFNAAYKEQIFEIFQRLNSRETYAGTGIGLALSKRVVANHHGRIVADSVEGRGATFTIYLPVEQHH